MMWDWHNAPMTILELVISCAVVLVVGFILLAMMIESDTGMPARTAVARCGYVKILRDQCHQTP